MSDDEDFHTPTPGTPTTEDEAAAANADGSPKPSPTEDDPPSLAPQILECPACPEEFIANIDLDKSLVGKPDPANIEFIYYSSTIREIAQRLTVELDRQLIIPWVRRLLRPEYHSTRLRLKRNKYLLYLSLILMNDETWGIFKFAPPQGPLPEPEVMAEEEEFSWCAEWERDEMWNEVLAGLPPEYVRMQCIIHSSSEYCQKDKENSNQLDEEFRYLLYLARPYCVLLKCADERTRAAAWLQTLCTVTPDGCSCMKKIRNDYITALLGYVHELRTPGPFAEQPWVYLPPLAEAARILAERRPVIDPCNKDVDEFLSSQPVPDEGAFCYLAITGELLDSALE